MRGEERPLVELVDAQSVPDQLGAVLGGAVDRRLAVEAGLPGDIAVRGQLTAYAGAGRDRGVMFQSGGQQRPGRARGQHVVAVEEHHELSGGGAQAVVARGAAAAAVRVAVDHPQPWFGVGEGVQGGAGAVGGGVVHRDHFGDRFARGPLRECGAHRLADMAGIVEGDDDDADLCGWRDGGPRQRIEGFFHSH